MNGQATITKDNNYGKNFQLVITERITNARRMMFIMDAMNVEQETTTDYDILRENVCDMLSKLGMSGYWRTQFFTGNSDVILEISVTIDCKDKPEEDICKEYCLGEFLTLLGDHFKYPKYTAYDLQNEAIGNLSRVSRY